MCIPVLALMIPDRLPQAVVLVALPLTVFMFWQERDAVRPRLVTWLLVGRVAGVLPAIGVLAIVPVRALQAIFAVATLAAVGLMAAKRMTIEITRTSQLAAGSLSSFIGTAAGLGGPPVALLYANQAGRDLRATLSLTMLVGNLASIVGYWLSDRLSTVDLSLSALLLLPTVLGLGVGVGIRRHLHGPRLRTAVLTLVTGSALVLLTRSISG